jgi:hypothetical protein
VAADVLEGGLLVIRFDIGAPPRARSLGGRTALDAVERRRTLEEPEATLKDRFHGVFNDRERDYGDSYLEVVRDNLKASHEGRARAFVVLVALGFLYVLVDVAAVEEVSFGPVKISDLSIVQKVIPVAYAYVVYTALMFNMLASTYYRAHQAALAERHPSIVSREVDVFLLPAAVTVFGSEGLVPLGKPRRAEWAYVVALVIVAGAALLAGLLFEAWALYRLFDRFGIDDLVSWISVALSGALLVLTALVPAAPARN